jgi:hypothetical protein
MLCNKDRLFLQFTSRPTRFVSNKELVSANNFKLKTMSEKNIILNDWSNRHSVMTPLPKESVNPIIQIFNRQVELILKFLNKVATP